jgi:nitrite reductase/ring-hydroxylating ferredoxin subunit
MLMSDEGGDSLKGVFQREDDSGVEITLDIDFANHISFADMVFEEEDGVPTAYRTFMTKEGDEIIDILKICKHPNNKYSIGQAVISEYNDDQETVYSPRHSALFRQDYDMTPDMPINTSGFMFGPMDAISALRICWLVRAKIQGDVERLEEVQDDMNEYWAEKRALSAAKPQLRIVP